MDWLKSNWYDLSTEKVDQLVKLDTPTVDMRRRVFEDACRLCGIPAPYDNASPDELVRVEIMLAAVIELCSVYHLNEWDAWLKFKESLADTHNNVSAEKNANKVRFV